MKEAQYSYERVYYFLTTRPTLLEVQVPYDPVDRLVGLSVKIS